MIVAVLDAFVLYPPSLRDILMRLGTSGVYAPRWTKAIQDEWARNVLADNQNVSPAQLQRTTVLMELANPGSLVEGYESHAPILSLPDPDDRHVLAAAIHASASHIVTYNLSDFPDSTLGLYGIEAIHPDLCMNALFQDDPAPFLSAVRRQRAALKNPPKSPQEYIDTMMANGLVETARYIDEHRDVI
jgi:hypothetical protein